MGNFYCPLTVLKARRAWKAQAARWDTIASAAGLENSRLVRAEDTRLGQRFTIDIRSTGSTAPRLAHGDLGQRVAAILGLPAEQVRLGEDPKHAGQLFITVQLRDPWAQPVPHPALTGGPVAPSGRSVMDGPFIIGQDPDSGRALNLTVFDTAGGHHTFLVGPTRKGKSVIYYNLVEQATDRRDVIVWGVDLGKGHLPGVCGPMLDASAGIKQHAQALRLLQWAVEVIEYRSIRTIGNHVPTSTAPVILFLVDEMDTLTGLDSPIAHKAKPLVDAIFRRGGSAGVVIATAGQRGVIQHTGSKEAHANAENRIVMRVNRPSEMSNVVPDWELDDMPNMATYARGVRGVALVVNGDGHWRAGRVRDLSDIPAVQELATQRGAPTATLESDLAAALSGYPDRHTPATQPARMRPLIPLPRQAAGSSAAPGDDTTREDTERREPADAISRLAQGLVAEVEAKLAGMPAPPDNPMPLTELLSVKATLDEATAAPLLELLTQRATEGARRDELVTAAGKSESTVKRCLRALREDGGVIARGQGKAARYYLADHDPASGQPVDNTDGDDTE